MSGDVKGCRDGITQEFRTSNGAQRFAVYRGGFNETAIVRKRANSYP
jgi:hypothetical protein